MKMNTRLRPSKIKIALDQYNILTEYDNQKGVWDTFEDFVEYYRSIWVITELDDVPEMSSCTCLAFAKKSLASTVSV